MRAKYCIKYKSIRSECYKIVVINELFEEKETKKGKKCTSKLTNEINKYLSN